MLNVHNGDLFDFIIELDNIIIPHVVNNIYKWGAGFVVPLGKRFPEAKKAFSLNMKPVLGSVEYVFSDGVLIANMYAQNGCLSRNNTHPLDYDALRSCMVDVSNRATALGSRIVAPAFGCGLAGGDINIVYDMINDIWNHHDVTICVL